VYKPIRKSDSSGEEQVLAERLRHEAVAGRPEFSETLHRQLCLAIRRCRTAGSAADPVPVPGRQLRYVMATAIAAVGLLAATVIAWQATRDDGMPPRAVHPSLAGHDTPVRPPDVSDPEGPHVVADTPTELEMVGELADLATEEIAILVASTVTEWQWGYLDQNAKLAFDALNNRVPLDEVACLIFTDGPTDSPQGSP